VLNSASNHQIELSLLPFNLICAKHSHLSVILHLQFEFGRGRTSFSPLKTRRTKANVSSSGYMWFQSLVTCRTCRNISTPTFLISSPVLCYLDLGSINAPCRNKDSILVATTETIGKGMAAPTARVEIGQASSKIPWFKWVLKIVCPTVAWIGQPVR
jgi:hypothetical protein